MRWWVQVAHLGFRQGVMVRRVGFGLGSIAVSLCGVACEVLPSMQMMSTNWSSVGLILALTSRLCRVGCRSAINRGEVKCSLW